MLVFVLACADQVPLHAGDPDIPFDGVRATKSAVALRTSEPVVIDGVLNEAAWERAVPATVFYQQQPDEGGLATMQTEVRFLYDAEYLYVGGTLFDPDPIRGPIINELKRDFSARDGDLITVVLDTFRDQRNAFEFMTNPAGAQRDAESYDDGRQINQNWDGVWFLKTARFERGWTMEMAIPFKTLRFRQGEAQEWGMNIFRLVRRINEVSSWAPVPRQFDQSKTSYAGVLTGISGVRPGSNFRVKPFVVAQGSNGVTQAKTSWTGDGDGGFDIKYGIGPSLRLDGSFRTDFSQVEADEQQINLTRFNLFFPEKREFFLENQGAFRVGDQNSSGQGGGRKDLLAFFSRRIGLSDEGHPIPVLGGARLTGKRGAYGIGLLQMWAESYDGAPRRSYTAARISHDTGGGSSMGAFYFGTESSADFNRVAGGDLHLNFRKTKDVYAFFLKSASPGVSGRDWAGRAAFSAIENGYTANVSYTNIQANYRNDLGFVPRSDVALVDWEYESNLRPRKTYRWVRTYTVGGEGQFFLNGGHDRLMSRVTRHDYSAEFADGGRFGLDLDWNYERLTEPFEIMRGVMVPAGEYRFAQAIPSYSSDRSRWLSGNVKMTLGQFWDGDITGIETGARVRVNEHLATSGSYARSHVTLPEGEFIATVGRFRVDYSFSTRMFLNAFLQYNSATRSWLSNVRFNFIHRPLSDIFVVYNDTRGALRSPGRALIVKYTHLILF